ncbi:hypothetical protein [Acetivibrio mesophilus]|uniref:Uncharacterized protein n=1 Tax=Acetivibrio mesophilus TaxID=2487273 RepID=A0A4Q0I2Z7_9FIRM|nr:hypothetical protein [Acetivibrio mesophilus]ODM27247.1 hypothetical protein A7W90_14085 [Clostridium sp. Bc-iso-3]RXE58055.1 hypothetical protein EFD62_14420 [Acetivibrio mesophilus]HHV29785.1 hypothetical protein [Clostridium sp.]
MNTNRKIQDKNNFEKMIKAYLRQGRSKLLNEFTGTREAMVQIASDKIKDFIKVMDIGLDEAEREYLRALIVSSMYQSFCYGYGIGKIEGKNENRVVI